jgi:hypothetical protein
MGGVNHLGTRPVPASVRGQLMRTARERGPAMPVERQQLAYWEERGWKRDGRVHTGSFQTKHGAFRGRIEQLLSGYIEFFLHAPSAEIRRHSHWACFQPWRDGWYRVHMGRQPNDVSSGIITIERLIAEAYKS